MYAKISIVILVFIVCVRGQEANSTDDVCEPIRANCICEAPEAARFVPLILYAGPTPRTYSGKINCSYDDPPEICHMICNLYSRVARMSTRDGPSNVEPTKGLIAAGGKRIRRSRTEPCGIPDFNNTAVECWMWPNWRTCNIECIYGHAFRVAGIGSVAKAQLTCRSTENKWKPHDFFECLPYWNCKPYLITPGTLKCREPNDGPVSCDISCEAYEGNEKAPLKTYTCTDSNYADQLPHCAVLEKDVKLVESP